jgi:hypothetical protein
MTTITASTTIGIDLNPAIYTSPVVIGAGVTVSNTGYPYAVYRHTGATTFFAIDNNGTITSGSGIGVYLAPGGSVTNAATASITGGSYGVKITGGTGTVVNNGSIAGGNNSAVDLGSGGSVTNGASAYIRANADILGTGAVAITGGAGTVVNYGSVVSDSQGIYLGAGGSVTNGPSAYIKGSVMINLGAGTVVNYGSMMGYGIVLHSGGSVTNGASADITDIHVFGGYGTVVNYGGIVGGGGVNLYSGGTLTNAGLITSNTGTAVAFGGIGGRNLLVLDPGFGFSGIVAGGTSILNTLELASTVSAGTITGMGSEFIHFGSIAFDAGARWFVSGIQRGLAGPISGFAVGDAIELTGVTATGSSFVGGILTLDLVGGGSATLRLPGTFTSASDFTVTNVVAGADVTVVCFLAGTHILTESGEIKVEDLVIGEHVITHSGDAKPIKWIGVGKVLATRGQRCAATPIIVRKGALGLNVPTRDLRVTKGHALYIDGVLIPVEELINQHSILWDDQAQEVAIYHIELQTHDVLIANGAPAESYRDDGNRWLFQNVNSEWARSPQAPCAPVLTSGPVVDMIWRRLLERTGLCHALAVTRDPDLHLLVDGKRIDAIERHDNKYVFRLGAKPRGIRVRSRSAVPQELGVARDPRPLGVSVRRIVLAQARRQRVVEADAASLIDGYHAFEPDNGIRWTDGDAALPAGLFAGMSGAGLLILHLGETTQYLAEDEIRCVA